MDQEAIIQYLTGTFAGLEVQRPGDGPGAGDTFFFYDPERNIDPTRRLPFATIVTKDYGEFDNASRLDRRACFGSISAPARTYFANSSGLHDGHAAYDFAALDRLMPHPVYVTQFYVCVLNPGAETFEAVKPLLAEAYSIAVRRHVGANFDHD
jgi:hypothetical protein